ncbi:interleukin-18 receptor accessory protein-like [Myripristis murdjan]|uniref:interleukin-18 receptor accessory protein-like n=1 Tax=Myripristis murdjan TaxID=586833 RepID=UPI001175FEDE|nr:interleukin-18 receptor accessory protein-like [Myripristis murdjan]
MLPGYTLAFAIIPVFLEGCCVEKLHKEKIDLPQETAIYRYQAVEGEFFMMQCGNSAQHSNEVVWSKCGEGRDENNHSSAATGRQNEDEVGVLSRDNVLQFRAIEAKDSGKYTCFTGNKMLFFHLEVMDKSSLGCAEPAESNVTLILDTGGEIPCPGFNCSDQASNTAVIWYKNRTAVSVLQKTRQICEEGSRLLLCRVYLTDTDVYFCDTYINNQGVIWTNRRAVNVIVIPQDTSEGPLIILPQDNKLKEVELGQPLTLTCEAKFGFQRNFSPLVKWYTNIQGNKEDMTPLHMESQEIERRNIKEFIVTRRAVINKVSLLHLKDTYTCIAGNAVGNSSATIRLKKKIRVKWPVVVGIPAVSFLLVAGVGILLRVKRLELSLIYRSRWQHSNKGEDEKEFDIFLSCVWSPLSEEAVEGLALVSPCGTETNEKVSLSSMARLSTVEGCATQRPLEVLLPQVLEERWGYRLCLLDRDLLPGGAYADDVACALKRSRMLICLLSAEYLSNSNAVFVLESGIQAFLQDSHLKLLLIWTTATRASLGHLDPPLPPLVRRALKVLPTLTWASGDPPRATSNFWTSLRKALPHRITPISLVQNQT